MFYNIAIYKYFMYICILNTIAIIIWRQELKKNIEQVV